MGAKAIMTQFSNLSTRKVIFYFLYLDKLLIVLKRFYFKYTQFIHNEFFIFVGTKQVISNILDYCPTKIILEKDYNINLLANKKL